MSEDGIILKMLRTYREYMIWKHLLKYVIISIPSSLKSLVNLKPHLKFCNPSENLDKEKLHVAPYTVKTKMFYTRATL